MKAIFSLWSRVVPEQEKKKGEREDQRTYRGIRRMMCHLHMKVVFPPLAPWKQLLIPKETCVHGVNKLLVPEIAPEYVS